MNVRNAKVHIQRVGSQQTAETARTSQGCGFFLGGSKEPASKKPKSCCPDAVVVTAPKEMSIFSTKTSTRDDRCFVMKKGDMFFYSHKYCISVRAVSSSKMGLTGLTTPSVRGICTFAVFLSVSRPFLSLHCRL